jgi:hypothetical protein
LRITVYDLLDYLASGMTEAEILADFPDLRASAPEENGPAALPKQSRVLRQHYFQFSICIFL